MAAARLILEFRERGTGHSIWKNELEHQVRPSLRQLTINRQAAEAAISDPEYELYLAKRGQCRAGASGHERCPAAARKRHNRAWVRFSLARGIETESRRAIGRIEALLIGRQLKQMGGEFRGLHARFAAACDQHSLALESLDRSPFTLATWRGTSACDVLTQIGAAILRLLQLDNEPRQFLAAGALEKDLDLDWDEWEQLDIAVRKEAAAVLSKTPPNAVSPPWPITTRSAPQAPPGPDGDSSHTDATAGLGNGGPAKALDEVCRAILAGRTTGTTLQAGDRVSRSAVMKRFKNDARRKKAADYLAPKGRLCVGGWILREDEDVVLTENGAEAGTLRQRARPKQA